MDAGVVNEFAEVMQRVKGWSPDLRIALAKGILDSLQPAGVAGTTHAESAEEKVGVGRAAPARKPKRGLSAPEVRSLFRTDRPAPDDETVERSAERPPAAARPPGKSSLRDLVGLVKLEGPPPTDDECRAILEEELVRKSLR